MVGSGLTTCCFVWRALVKKHDSCILRRAACLQINACVFVGGKGGRPQLESWKQKAKDGFTPHDNTKSRS